MGGDEYLSYSLRLKTSDRRRLTIAATLMGYSHPSDYLKACIDAGFEYVMRNADSAKSVRKAMEEPIDRASLFPGLFPDMFQRLGSDEEDG